MKACKHKFEKVVVINRWFGLSKQSYSVCKKCGAIRHDNDGHIFKTNEEAMRL